MFRRTHPLLADCTLGTGPRRMGARYQASEKPARIAPRLYSLTDTTSGQVVDQLRTQSGAEHAAHLLNRGVARVNEHAIIGCRVEGIA